MLNIEALHQLACDQLKDTYIDPVSGYQVLTSHAHIKRGRCCGNACRHCPFGHIHVPPLDTKGGKRNNLPNLT